MHFVENVVWTFVEKIRATGIWEGPGQWEKERGRDPRERPVTSKKRRQVVVPSTRDCDRGMEYTKMLPTVATWPPSRCVPHKFGLTRDVATTLPPFPI